MDANCSDNKALSHISQIADLEHLLCTTGSLSTLQNATSGIHKSINFISTTIGKARSNIISKQIISKQPLLNHFLSQADSLKLLLDSFSTPLSIINLRTPIIVQILKDYQKTGDYGVNFSGQVWALQSVLPSAQNLVNKYKSLLITISKTGTGISSILGKLKILPGVSVIMSNLENAIGTLGDNLANSLEVVDLFSKTASSINLWLPVLQEGSRKTIKSESVCQFIKKTGLFSKSVCGKSVWWYDDQGISQCPTHGIFLCEEHRVAIPCAIGDVLRNRWECLNCAHNK